MTGKEVIARTVDFKNPPYIAHTIAVVPGFLSEKDPTKLERIQELLSASRADINIRLWCFDQHDTRKDGVTYRTDEWGTKFEDDGHGMFSTFHPAEEGYEFMNRVTFPDAARPGRFDASREAFAKTPDRYNVGGVWFTLFERLWMLRGFNNMLMDPYVEEDDFLSLKEKVMEVNLAMIDEWLKLDSVDALFFSDDWGSQRSLLISPSDWRKYYRNDYRRMFEKVRAAGKHVFMHLCGNITEILPDLIDLGLNVLNPVQPQAMNLEYLSKEFRGKVCFNGGIDVQGVMVNGSPDEVKAETRRVAKLLGNQSGGYVFNTSHSLMPETPLDNIIALLETVLEYR